MGTAYDRPVTQWSKGEYAGASAGIFAPPDDLANIAALLPFAPDDHGDTPAAATPLDAAAAALAAANASSPGAVAFGVIGANGDVDAFSIRVDAPFGATLTLRLDILDSPPSPRYSSGADWTLAGANLNAAVTLRAPNGSAAAVWRADANAGALLAGTWSVAAPKAGTYHIFVEGAPLGADPTVGFSRYGSAGRYALAARVEPAAPPALNGGNYTYAMPHNASSFTPPLGGGLLSNTTIDPRCPVNATGTLTQPPTEGGSVTVQPDGTYVYTAPNASWSGELQVAGCGQAAAIVQLPPPPPRRCSPLACILLAPCLPLGRPFTCFSPAPPNTPPLPLRRHRFLLRRAGQLHRRQGAVVRDHLPAADAAGAQRRQLHVQHPVQRVELHAAGRRDAALQHDRRPALPRQRDGRAHAAPHCGRQRDGAGRRQLRVHRAQRDVER